MILQTGAPIYDYSKFTVPRRKFLIATVASSIVPALLSPECPGAATQDPGPNNTTLKAGDLTAIVGDNAAEGEHRSGYNGVWSLRHASSSRDIFVPAFAGLNLEHIVTGEHLDDSSTFFEPRNAPMSIRQISDTEAELHQPPTPMFHVESWTRFRLIAPHYLDMSFRCVPHESVFPRGYLALFWAS